MVTCPTCLTNILKIFPESDLKICPTLVFGYLCDVRIRSAGEMTNYFDFYSMQADSLHVCVPISVLNSFSTKILVRQVGHVTIELTPAFSQTRKSRSGNVTYVDTAFYLDFFFFFFLIN